MIAPRGIDELRGRTNQRSIALPSGLSRLQRERVLKKARKGGGVKGTWRRNAYTVFAAVSNRASSLRKHHGCDPMPAI